MQYKNSHRSFFYRSSSYFHRKKNIIQSMSNRRRFMVAKEEKLNKKKGEENQCRATCVARWNQRSGRILLSFSPEKGESRVASVVARDANQPTNQPTLLCRRDQEKTITRTTVHFRDLDESKYNYRVLSLLARPLPWWHDFSPRVSRLFTLGFTGKA